MKKQGPLTGLRVVESASFITGPYASQTLADLGADVVKVEPPAGGDPFRAFAGGLYSCNFIACNRNKRSVQLDLRTVDGKAAMKKLLTSADVFIQNQRPGAIDRLGFGYETVREWNPRLVYCSISGMGQSGPYAHRPAYDTVGQGLSGMMSLIVQQDKPQIVGPAFSDGITGLTASQLVLAALWERERSGQGQHVDVSMLEATTAFVANEAIWWLQEKEVSYARTRPMRSQSYAATCADGKMVAIHLSSIPKFWEGLCKAIEREDLLNDDRYASRMARVKHFEELHELLAEELAKRPRHEWLRLLDENDVPHTPIYTMDEVFEDPQVQYLGLEVQLEHPTEGRVGTVAPPGRFSRTPWGNLAAPPTVGEHSTDILEQLKTVDWPA